MSQLTIRQVVNSVYNSNSYILSHSDGEGKEVWIIDMGDTDRIIEALPSGAIVKGVFLTHTHYDHIYGLNAFIAQYPHIHLYTNAAGKKALLSPMLNYSRYHLEAPDFIYNDPDNITVIEDGESIALFDDVSIKVIATPGHDASCLTYIVGDYVFSGDSFIPGVCTRATFRLSDKDAVTDSENRIKELASGKTLCPGHESIYEEYKNE